MGRSSSYRSQCPRSGHSALEEKPEENVPFFVKQQEKSAGQNNQQSFFQAKLDVNQPGDQLEQEADKAADKVVNNQGSGAVVQQKEISGIQRLATPAEDEKLGTNDQRMLKDKEIQTKSEKGDDKDKKEGVQMKGMEQEKEKDKLQKKGDGSSSSTASSSLSQRIKRSSGGGSALPSKTKAEMGASFGYDFSHVNIHTGKEAAQMNKELHAQAFTHGNDIYFNSGKFDPESSSGKHLLAHELTHVIQQGAAGEQVQRKVGDGHDLQAVRFSGDQYLESAFDNESFVRKGASGNHVFRLQAALRDLGYSLPEFGVDGQFGSETERAMRAFQSDHELVPDAVVGTNTMGSLDNIYANSGLPTCPANQNNQSTFGENAPGDANFPIPCQQGGQPGVTTTCSCQNPPTNDDCSKQVDATSKKNKMTIIFDAVKEAVTWLPNAQASMDDYITNNGANTAAATALNKHFSWNSTTKKTTTIDVPAAVKKAIDNTFTNITDPFCGNCQNPCPAGGKDTFASSPNAWKNSNCYEFCDAFFSASKTLQAKIILHEMMHSWENKSDIAYEVDGPPTYPPIVNTSSGNADSIASLIRDLK